MLDWHDEFDGTELDTKKWLPQYLPHNTSSDIGCMTTYEMGDGSLKLMITEDTPEYFTGGDVGFKASSIQTYEKNSLHANNAEGATVAPYKSYTTQYGYFETRYKVPSCGGGGHIAWWMVGTQYDAREDGSGSEQNGEIDVTETYLWAPNLQLPKVHAWDDPDLFEWEEAEVALEGDFVNEWHTYAMDWTPDYLAFYVDGEEIARTEQSPQYEMCILLSIYTNNDETSNYWSGIDNGVYPKVWEIDYFRVYKAEGGYPNGKTKPSDPKPDPALEGLENVQQITSDYMPDADAAPDFADLASSAVLTFDEETMSGNGLANLNSAAKVDPAHAYDSEDKPQLPQEFTLTWDSPQTFNKLQLYAHYALGQAPTVLELKLQKEGSSEWETAAGYQIKWRTNTEAVEYAEMDVPGAEDVTGLKIVVRGANLNWDHYVITKLYVYQEGAPAPEQSLSETERQEAESVLYDADSAQKIADLAPQAVLTYDEEIMSGNGLSNLNNGAAPDPAHAYDSEESPRLPQEFTLTWSSPQTFDTLNLYAHYALGQAPTLVELMLQKEGGSEWTKAAEYQIKWQSESETVECVRLDIPGAEDVTGLKIVVREANLNWNHYVITKLQVYQGGSSKPAADSAGSKGNEVTSSMYDGAAGQNIADLASRAVLTYNENIMSGNGLSNLNNGAGVDPAHAYDSEEDPQLPQEFTLTWPSPQTFDKLNLYAHYAQGQAPTLVELQLQKPGSSEWTKAAEYRIRWQTQTEAVECAELDVPGAEGVTGLKIVIREANMIWNHYVITKLHVYQEGASGAAADSEGNEVTSSMYDGAAGQNIADLASQAVLTYNENIMSGNGLSNLNSSAGVDPAHAYDSEEDPQLPQEFTLTWSSPQTFNKLNLYAHYAQGQAPTLVELQLQKPGSSEWTKAAEYRIRWQTQTEAVEYAVLDIPGAEGVTGLKIVIREANLIWNHYVITKLHVYQEGAANAIRLSYRPTVSYSRPFRPSAQKPDPIPEGLEDVENVSSGMYDAGASPGFTDLASRAVLTYNEATMHGSGLSSLIDSSGVNPANAYVSEDNPQFPQEFTLAWSSPQNINKLNLYAHYAKGQAPTVVELQIRKQGIARSADEWTTAASYYISWNTNDDVVECAALDIPGAENITGLKIVVHAANLIWNHYAITKLQVYQEGGSESEPPTPPEFDAAEIEAVPYEKETAGNIVDLAVSASLTYDETIMYGRGLSNLNSAENENMQGSYDSEDDPQFPQEFTLTWSSPQTFDTLNLYSRYAENQAPALVELKLRKDGSEEWETAAGYRITWQGSTEDVECAVLDIPGAEDVVGLKLVVWEANLTWGHYVITKLHVYQEGASGDGPDLPEPPTPPEPPVTPEFEAQEVTSGKYEAENAPEIIDLAQSAELTYNAETMHGDGLGVLNSAENETMANAYVSEDDPQLPQEFTLTWSSPQTFDKLNLYSRFAENQAPALVELKLRKDGSEEWETAAGYRITWQGNTEDVECAVLDIPGAENVAGLKLVVWEANLTWKHYVIAKLHVYKKDASEIELVQQEVSSQLYSADMESQIADFAKEAGLSYNGSMSGSGLQSLNDGNIVNKDSAYVSENDPQLPQEFTLTWNSPQTFDTLNLYSHFALGQAPTEIELQIRKEGSEEWKPAALYQIEWLGSTEDVEYAALHIPGAESVTGLKIVVREAHLDWGHYVVKKLHVYKEGTQPVVYKTKLQIPATPSNAQREVQIPASPSNAQREMQIPATPSNAQRENQMPATPSNVLSSSEVTLYFKRRGQFRQGIRNA